MNDREDRCPKCDAPYNPEVDQIIECPRCHAEGSTACCNSGGRGVACVADGMPAEIGKLQAKIAAALWILDGAPMLTEPIELQTRLRAVLE